MVVPPRAPVPPAAGPAAVPEAGTETFPARVACIDIGSNGIRLAAAEYTTPQASTTLLQERAPVRLGRSVFLDGAIDSTTMDEAVSALKGYKGLLDRIPGVRIRVVATSAVRDARNRKLFLRRVAREAGLKVEVITGAEEARLVHLAVSRRLGMDGKTWLLCDVGGGSVEVSLASASGLAWTESFRMGGVRLLESFRAAEGHPERARRLVEETIGTLRLPAFDPAGLAGLAATGGNIEELAQIAGTRGELDKVEVLNVKDLAKLLAEMQKLTAEERAKKWNLKRDRADVILPAGLVYLHVALLAHVTQIHVPHVALKEGVLADMVADVGIEPGAPERRAIESALALGRRYRFDESHGRHVATLALSMFDQLQSWHKLGERDRAVLAAASILHDVGRHIADEGHHRHSFYLISQAELAGLDPTEVDLVAQVARYHRKAEPKLKHEPFARLSVPDRDRVERLSALLRVADALDRQHRATVKSVTCTPGPDQLRLGLVADGDVSLEQWAVERKGGLFERLFATRIVCEGGAVDG